MSLKVIYTNSNQTLASFIMLICCFLFSIHASAQKYRDMMYDSRYNIYDVVEEAEVYFNALTPEQKFAKGSGWTGYQRWLYENESKYYPSGDRSKVDPYFVSKAHNEFKKEISSNRMYSGSWVDLGPYYIEQVTGHYAVGLGRVESFYVDPNNDQRIYLGSRSGGFWKTIDGGTTWTGGSTDFLDASGVNTIAVSPTNPDAVFINVRNAKNGATHGIYQSTNGGDSWTITNFNPSNLGWGGLGSNRKIYRIAYHPTIANLVFVGTNNGLFRSTDNLVTWTSLLGSYDITEIEFHPSNPNIVYAAANNDNTVVLISTDAGLNFTPSAIPGNTSTVHLSVSVDCPDCVYVGTSDGIWKSVNAGVAFSLLSSPGISNYGAFAVSDVDVNYMLFGDIDTHMSTDEGLTFTKTTFWSQGNASYATNDAYVHADIRGARCINGVFWTGTDGFLCKSSDNGITWQRFEGQGIRENYNLGVSQSNHYRTISGSQDNGTSILTESTWIEFYGADGMEGIIYPLNNDWMIGSFQNGGRRRTKDGGITQSGVTPSGQNGYWIAPLVYDPNNPMTVYHFGENVFKSDDFGSTWTNVGTPGYSGVIKFATIAENNSDIIVAARDEFIEKSMDGGATFSSIKGNLPNYSITDVAFDPNDDSTIVVTYGRYQNDNSKVFITTDQGITWQNITYNLNNMPVKSVVIDHTDASTIYLGTEIGVYKKAMSDVSWTLYSPDLPNVTILELEVMYGSNTLRAATWGRGLWEYALDGRSNYPAILTTELTQKPTEIAPEFGMDQYVTSTISYDNTITAAYVKWSAFEPTFGSTISMSNTSGDTWVSDNAIPAYGVGTKIYFKVFAEGSAGDTSETYKFMYTVQPEVALNEEFIPMGSEWSYYDNQQEPDPQVTINWTEIAYDDATWNLGDAQLGYGDGDEATVINNATETAYFRKTINVSNPGLYTELDLGLTYDDGAIVYLNGTEVWRVNMPSGPVDYNTVSSSQSSDNASASTLIPNTLISGDNEIAVEVHQRSTNSSDISFDFSLVAIQGECSASGDPCDDGDICTTNDTYDADCNCVGTSEPDADGDGVCDLSDQCPGFDDNLLGTACDDGELFTIDDKYVDCVCTGTEVTELAIVEYGSGWSYYDNADEPGLQGSLDWNDNSYDASAWATGNSHLGYGDGDEATVINNATEVVYVRHSFNVDDPSVFESLNLGLIYDDGAVVYLNGVEIWRVNMPSGTITYDTFASSTSSDNAFASAPLLNVLQTGVNVIAVEVHQRSATSSDLSFDLELVASPAGVVNILRGPYLQKGSASSMVIRWRTFSPTESIVNYGTSLGNLTQNSEDLVLKTEHEIEITGLNPDTKYYYELANSEGVFLPEASDQFFRTHPVIGEVQPYTFWILGDPGTANDNQRAVRDAYYNYIGNAETDGILFLGDNAYNSGTDLEYQYALFEDMYENKLKNTIAWSTLGNHDGYSANSSNQTGPYYDIFTFPTAGESGGMASGTEAYYSFDYGNIHFIVLESYETDRSVGGDMYNWAQSDIQNTTQEWIVAFWHHPAYSKGSHNSDTESALVQMRENFLPMLESNGIDLVLSGHSHSYERSYYLNGHYDISDSFNIATHTVGLTGSGDGKTDGGGAYIKEVGNPDGAVYITTGSAGKTSSGNLDHEAMYYSVSELGSCILEVNGCTLSVKFLRETGDVEDYFTIEGDCDGDGVTDSDEVDPDGDGVAGGTGPNGPATDPQNPCEFNAGDITLTVTAVTDCDGDGDDSTTDPDNFDPCAYSGSQVFTNADQAWLDNDCDGDGVTNGDEVDPDGDGEAGGTGPNGSATNPKDSCDFNAGDITLTVTAVSDCDSDGDDSTTDPNDFDPCAYSGSQIFTNADQTWLDNDCDGDGVTNRDEVDPDGNGTDEGNGTDTQNPCAYVATDITLPITTVVGCIDLSLTKSVDVTSASVGDTVTFTMTLSNDGTHTATNIEVSDATPLGYSYVAGTISSDAGATGAIITENDANPLLLLWDVNQLDAAENITFSFQAKVTGVDDYVNWAEISDADQVDINSDPSTSMNIDDLTDGLVDNDEDSAQIALNLDLTLWVYLEGSLVNVNDGTYPTIENPGPLNPVFMRTDMNNLGLLPGQTNTFLFQPDIYNLPGQPYDVAPWLYTGTEGDDFDSGGDNTDPARFAGYPSTLVDWVLVSLRSDPLDGSQALCQRTGLLHSDGHIEFMADADCYELDLSQSYYVLIEHRNHLIVMSDTAVAPVDGNLEYDFRFHDSYLNDPLNLGTFLSQKEVTPGIFAMYAGNGDQTSGTATDTDVNASDYTKWLNIGLQLRTYNFTDYNMSGDRNANDFELWQTNSPRNTTVPRN